jgi:hypothetical protein
MAITFVCRCGKRLRARDNMAQRRSICPACGAPVGIPSREPSADGRAGPMTPEEISRRRGRVNPEAEAPTAAAEVGTIQVWVRQRKHNPDLERERQWRPLDAPLTTPTDAAGKLQCRRHRRRRRFELESRWYHCLLYPLRALGQIGGLSLILAVLTTLAVQLLPQLGEFDISSGQGWLPVLILSVPLLILGYAAAFLDVVVSGAVAGGEQYVSFPGLNVPLILRSAVKWAACFLAGPIVPAAGAVWYWVQCGDPTPLDYVILGELVVLSVAWWLMALLSINDTLGWSGLAPWRVHALIARMKWRCLPALAAPAAAIAAGWLALSGVDQQHHNGFVGFLMLIGAWLTALTAGTFFLRLLGVWCNRSRKVDSRQ